MAVSKFIKQYVPGRKQTIRHSTGQNNSCFKKQVNIEMKETMIIHLTNDTEGDKEDGITSVLRVGRDHHCTKSKHLKLRKKNN